MGKWTDLKGKIFHDVEAIEYLGSSSWKCKCLKCGKIFNRKSSVLKRYGCKCKFINTINENYFDEIDTADKSYIFGFMWADAYCSNTTRQPILKIDLQDQDKELLLKFKDKFNWSGNITSYVAKKGHSYRPEDSIVYRLAICNKGFINSLCEKGLVPHRELSHLPYNCLSSKYTKDFIRGYFDGNGSISIDKNNRICVNICGGTNIVNDIASYLVSELEISHISSHHRRVNNPNNTTIVFTRNKDKLKILNFLYNNSSLYLDRKYNKYQKAITILNKKNNELI